MDILFIDVPYMNDSMSLIKIDGIQYYIRFTWNDNQQCWYFGIYTFQREAVYEGIKIVANCPLNTFYTSKNYPQGIFIADSDNDTISKTDFALGNAVFMFLEESE